MCGGLQEIYDDGVKQGMQLVIKISNCTNVVHLILKSQKNAVYQWSR